MLLPTKDFAYKKIASLVERFEDQKESYRKDYNETQTRRDFIDPFFKSLGWDVDNENGYAESYREVIHEDRVKIDKATKAPDYSFRLVGGKRLFFVEAKKPSVLIKAEVAPAYQVRRYGWSAKLPISVITDFEEFAIYDCTQKPSVTDKASNARIKYLTYQEYLNDFEFIWDTFSKERVLKGSFDKFIQNDKHKKGTTTVDHEFLQSLDNWRTYLATSIAANNKDLNEDELNFVVQQTIDRIIFLRIAEDRSIEPYGRLKESIKTGNYYQNLFDSFKEADDKYNSGLFDFSKDKLSRELTIDNKVIKTVINDLYYPISPYEFSVLSVEILGSAYEQFLGKQITLGRTGIAVIEQKPEVRKAGGVYYTPQYIVNYIVENTVGKLLQGKTPVEASSLKIVDPACGSGSFLIGAYDHLLKWHKDIYTKDGKQSKGNKAALLTPDGNLTTAEKKRILLNNIYGVDIDLNAVEVTKLSLLLKCMEGETNASIATQLRLFNDRILPTLDNNIKSGNSLIDTDFYSEALDFNEEKKIKPFNWQKAFPEVLKKGGFDTVIGNPPYVLLEGEFRNDDLLTYFKKKYTSASYKIDLYHLFYEKGLYLLKENGKLGFITPSNYLSNNRLVALRATLLDNSFIEIINVIAGRVFSASVDTTVTILSKSQNKQKSHFIHSNWTGKVLEETSDKEFDQNNFRQNEGQMFISTTKNIKFNRKIYELGESYFVKFGMQLRDRKIYEADVITNKQKDLITKYHRPCYTGKNVSKWKMKYDDMLAYFNREAKSGGCWDESMHNAKPKIIVRQIGVTPICALDEKGYCCLNTVFMIIPKIESSLNLKFLLGILNSSLIASYWKHNFSDLRQTFPKIKGGYLEKLPLPAMELSNK